jgi:hypothetical protein
VSIQQPIDRSNSKDNPYEKFFQGPFKQAFTGIGMGSPVPDGWQSVATQPLVILVGTTGVGKSTTTAALVTEGLAFTLLPNRRNLSSLFAIAPMAEAEGKQVQSLCRIERLNYARRFREKFAGGMACILENLWVDPTQIASMLLFDGLRGEDEVRYAAKVFPHARFVILDAPDYVRLQRLIGRNDPFDRVTQSGAEENPVTTASEIIANFNALGVPEAAELFSLNEERELVNLVQNGVIMGEELRDKLKIILEERCNYDPQASRLTLKAIAPERTLVIDTTTHTPLAVARAIINSLNF